ncbi:DUF6114 domain-containing protein [Streptomyces abyssomicinicus]|uniref:DUF6114 domain-containing protein n=1 Tax=Streptomyces abyssomicinicus TaxID=574929 RepID=UPI001FE588C8|nr:DUF6114 domain-containing protein [Streptomyces abyssomicinicus]
MASDSTPENTPDPSASTAALEAHDTSGTTAHSTTADSTAAGAEKPRRVSRFAAWRWRRPFWGGLLLTLAGTLIMIMMVQGSLEVALASGPRGVVGYILPALMIICGVLTLFSPAQRVFYSIVGLLSSLGAWVTSNMGAFMIGTILGVTGSTLIFGWLPEQGPRGKKSRRRKREEAPAAPAV